MDKTLLTLGECYLVRDRNGRLLVDENGRTLSHPATIEDAVDFMLDRATMAQVRLHFLEEALNARP